MLLDNLYRGIIKNLACMVSVLMFSTVAVSLYAAIVSHQFNLQKSFVVYRCGDMASRRQVERLPFKNRNMLDRDKDGIACNAITR